ncbi:MAG: Nif3-like dinuclear metal center hexameric protein [Sphaerochaetaceae bacterium]|nr:Nif3-like dinuclear metal center hexameric protein [Sphaerochaetaceae bacterium]
MKLKELTDLLNVELGVEEFEGIDISLNGLQVGDKTLEVKKIAFAVDACQSTIEKAVSNSCDLLIVHHGLFWGKPLSITGTHYKRIKTLLDNNVGLYACHLPLDASSTYGNNISIAKALELKDVKKFGWYHSKQIGFSGRLKEVLSAKEIVDKLGIKNENIRILPFGKDRIETVGIISGGAPYEVNDALKEGLDAYVTGECAHEVYHTCEEGKINMICLGHYSSETFGVKTVKVFLEDRGFTTVFVDVPTNL